MGSFKLNQSLLWSKFNTSKNKIIEYNEYVDNWDTWGQEEINYKKWRPCFLNLIWSSSFNYKMNQNTDIEFIMQVCWRAIYR